jgi:two-component system response regulator EvgA
MESHAQIMPKAIIVDDHPFVLATVRILVENAGFNVVAESDNGADTVNLCERLHPDLLILDLAIPGLDGIEVIQRLIERRVKSKIVVLTSQNNPQYIMRCMRAGAVGYVSKKESLSNLTAVIKAVMSGALYFPNVLNSGSEIVSSDEKKLASLSNREIVVMQYLIDGMNNKKIAGMLSLSEKTVSTYKTRLFEKLNVSSVLELAEFAHRNDFK